MKGEKRSFVKTEKQNFGNFTQGDKPSFNKGDKPSFNKAHFLKQRWGRIRIRIQTKSRSWLAANSEPQIETERLRPDQETKSK